MRTLTSYDVVYIITSLFGTYIIFKFMQIFFDRDNVNKRIELVTYIAYYFIITAAYLLINIPIVMMILNIVAFIGLSFNYQSTFKRRILSSILIYIILMCIEMIVVLLSGYINFPVFAKNYYSSIWGIICIKVVSYILVLLITNYINIKKGISIPTTYWFCICVIPFSSLYCMLVIFQSDNLVVNQELLCITLLLLTNFGAFHLYDVITAASGDKIEKIFLAQQNKYYNKQFEIMRTSLETRKAERHDLKNHLSVIESLVQKDEKEKVIEHIAMMMDVCVKRKEYAFSGNMVIDSILNFKLQEAEQNGITVNSELIIPEYLNVSSFDMTIILGNIIDNAINAAKKLEENRKIDLKIKYNKSRLLIKLDNTYDGKVVYKNNELVTSHADKDNHGIGLRNVRKAIEKYDGTMEIGHTNEFFSIMILMFVK